MAKKKTSKASEKTASSLREALGIDKIFFNERINFVLGFCLLIVAGYLIWAFISYFATGAADQSLIESPRDGEIMNEAREFQNSCGSLGAYAAHFFIKRCFGLSAFFIPVFMMMVAVTMMRAYKVHLLKWFMSLAIMMIWSSVTFSKFLAPFFEDACFNPGGDHGLAICQQIEGLLGVPGLTALLGLSAVAFLVYLSMETVIIIRKFFNPLHYLKKIPMTINVGGGDEEPANKDSEDNRVFDDPETEEINFSVDDDSVVIKQEPMEPVNTQEPDEEDEKGEGTEDDTDFVIEETEEEESAHGKTVAGDYGDISTPYDPKRDLENYKYPTLETASRSSI